MPYLTATREIRALITQYSQERILWVDTEVADYRTKDRRVSLIQLSADANDRTGESTYILDVLEQPELVTAFVNQIMTNPQIEKVFHQATYDVQFLGGDKAVNVSCTLKMAAKIPYYILPIPNRKLKTLAEQLCHFPDVNKDEQGGD